MTKQWIWRGFLPGVGQTIKVTRNRDGTCKNTVWFQVSSSKSLDLFMRKERIFSPANGISIGDFHQQNWWFQPAKIREQNIRMGFWATRTGIKDDVFHKQWIQKLHRYPALHGLYWGAGSGSDGDISTVTWFPEMGVPPVIIRFSRIFHYKPSILGYPKFRKPPYIYIQIHLYIYPLVTWITS